MDEQRIDLGEMYQQIVNDLYALEIQSAELRGQKDLIERLIQQAQRPSLSGDPLDDRMIRDERDVLMSRLGEAQQGLSIIDEAGQAPPAAAAAPPTPRYIGEVPEG